VNAPNAASSSAASRAVSPGYAWYALGVLSFINLINYLDRNVLPPVVDSVKQTFAIDDGAIGLLGSAFFIVYTIVSPAAGYLGDRVKRRTLIVSGILLWSVATVASAFAQDFEHLLIARAMTGVGEAGYGIVAPAFLSDLFSKESRSRTLSVFYLALPVGTAAGYAWGGYIGQHFGHATGAEHTGLLCSIGIHEGWRYAFFSGGIPGICLAVLAMFLREPRRGGMDADLSSAEENGKFAWGSVMELLTTKSFLVNVAATTAMTFAIGGLAHWVPAFVQRVHGYTQSEAGQIVGIVVAAAGTVGTVAGGFFADYARRWTTAAHFVVPGITLLLSAAVLLIAFLASSREVFWTLGGLGIFFLFCNSGPLNAAILNVSMPNVRATAFAAMIFTIHMLGDAASPTIIGWISDRLAGSHGYSPGEALRYAFLLAPPIVAVGGLLLLIFSKWLPQDMDRLEARLKGSAAPGA